MHKFDHFFNNFFVLYIKEKHKDVKALEKNQISSNKEIFVQENVQNLKEKPKKASEKPIEKSFYI